jgi:hypothetical protein
MDFIKKEQKMKWYKTIDKLPKPGDVIVAKLDGCKVCDYIFMTVREGEGMAHIKEWCYAVKQLYKEGYVQ